MKKPSHLHAYKLVQIRLIASVSTCDTRVMLTQLCVSAVVSSEALFFINCSRTWPNSDSLDEVFVKYPLCSGMEVFAEFILTVYSRLCRAYLPGGPRGQLLWIPSQVMADDQQAWRGGQRHVLWLRVCHHEQTGEAHCWRTHLHHRHEERPTR